MSVSRYRSQFSDYHQPHIVGKDQMWDSNQRRWITANNIYCPVWANYWRNHIKECSDELHPGPPWKSGGPLFIKELDGAPPCANGPTKTVTDPSGSWRYVGKFTHAFWMSDYGYSYLLPNTDIGTQYGATGWNRFRPGRSSSDLGQFLAELRDFKSLFRAQLKTFKGLGSAYLNVQFGWKPFLNDIVKFYKAMGKVEKTIDFLRKNNNRWISRGGTIKKREEEETSGEVPCMVYPMLNTYFHSDFPISESPTKYSVRIQERVWFKAKMKYYIPSIDKDRCVDVMTSPLLRRIYGLDIGPSLLWELTPWSWLADWFSNAGDIIATLEAKNADNLVAKYAYVMRSYERHVIYDTSLKVTTREEGKTAIKLHSDVSIKSKQRAEANPFGFHLDWGDLSPYQLSILAALGVSRGII